MNMSARRASALLLCFCLVAAPAAHADDGEAMVASGGEAVTTAPTNSPTPTPEPEKTQEPTSDASSLPSATPTPPSATPTPPPEATPTPPPATPTPPPEATPTPAPVFGAYTVDENQPDPESCALHFEITRALDDVRVLDVLLLLLPADAVNTKEELLAAVKGLPEESWAEENQLWPDDKDSKQRYAASVPYGTRFAFALRVRSSKELVVSPIYDPLDPQDAPATPTPDPNATPEPEIPPDDSEWDEFEEPEVPPQVPSADQAPYVKPKDDDMDGLFSRTEYRLGLDPQRRDSLTDGYWDALRLYLGEALIPDAASEKLTGPTPAPALTSTPRETPEPEPTKTPAATATPDAEPTATPEPTESPVLKQAPDAAALQQSVDAGLIASPVGDPDPAAYAADYRKKWTSGGTSYIGFIDHSKLRMALINNRAVFTGTVGSGEQLVVDGAISLSSMGLGGKNYNSVRSFDVSRDGALALLCDRRERGAELTDDARIIDLVNMRAYRVIGTKNALNIAMSPDGRYLAYATKEYLVRLDLSTGERFVEADPSRLERVDMLSFTKDDVLITRVTSMGCTALSPSGEWTLAAPEGIVLRGRDLNGLTVYDKDQLELDINIQVYYQTTGLYVKGEDKKAVRNFSPSYFRRSLLNKEIEP